MKRWAERAPASPWRQTSHYSWLMRDWRRELPWRTARKTAVVSALSVAREVQAATEWAAWCPGARSAPYSRGLCCVRCNSARQLKDDSGIRPFFQPEKSRNHQGYCSRHLKYSQDPQVVHWVSPAGSTMGHNRTTDNTTPTHPPT